jgi:transposase-like protein
LLFLDPGIFPRKNPRIMSSRSHRLPKGVFLMTSLSLAECCRLLAIDPKTLHQWVAQAQMALHTDPTNAKIKCLEVEQVQSLARLHGRVLQLPAAAATATISQVQSQMLPTPVPDADLRARLAQMEAQVAILQAQLTDLALQLLRERELRAKFTSEDHPSVSFSGGMRAIQRRSATGSFR